jgi:hypothetical protein
MHVAATAAVLANRAPASRAPKSIVKRRLDGFQPFRKSLTRRLGLAADLFLLLAITDLSGVRNSFEMSRQLCA